LLATIHRLPNRLSAVLPVRVKLDPYRLRIKLIKIHLDLEDVMIAVLLGGERTESYP
jgi:hypothetical protein